MSSSSNQRIWGCAWDLSSGGLTSHSIFKKVPASYYFAETVFNPISFFLEVQSWFYEQLLTVLLSTLAKQLSSKQ